MTEPWLESKCEAGALAELAPDLDLAAEEAGVLLRDRQAEAGPTAAAGRIGLVEALEQVGQVLRRNPPSLVDHLDEGTEPVPADTNSHAAPAMLQSVSDQVGDDALQPARIAREHDLLFVEPHPLFPATRANGGRRKRPEVDGLGLHALYASVEAGDLHQVL